jgi:small subunit ribosomal protein S16
MAVKMRLTRMGDNKTPFYRIIVCDSRKARDAEYLDKIGYYNPLSNPVDIKIDAEKANKWLKCGVQPTETVKSLLVKQGVIPKPDKLSPSRTKTKKKKEEKK